MQTTNLLEVGSRDFFERFLAIYNKMSKPEISELKHLLYSQSHIHPNTVTGWLTRKSIPVNQQRNVLDALNKLNHLTHENNDIDS